MRLALEGQQNTFLQAIADHLMTAGTTFAAESALFPVLGAVAADLKARQLLAQPISAQGVLDLLVSHHLLVGTGAPGERTISFQHQLIQEWFASQSVETLNPTEIFKFLTMHFGVKERGHPGLTRPEQIVGLAPYFDLIEEKDLDWLAEGCNAVGWFDLRRRLFDPKIPNSSECWTEARLPGLFDRLAEEKRFVSLDIERVLETGLSWPAVAAALKKLDQGAAPRGRASPCR